MKKIVALLLAVNLLAFGMPVTGAVHPELKAFPPASEGMERFVIVLPHKERGEEIDIYDVKFGSTDINGGDCFHPSKAGHARLADTEWCRTALGAGDPQCAN